MLLFVSPFALSSSGTSLSTFRLFARRHFVCFGEIINCIQSIGKRGHGRRTTDTGQTMEKTDDGKTDKRWKKLIMVRF